LQLKHRLKRECALADTRLATKKNEASRHKTSAKHAVQLAIIHVDARLGTSLNLV
jgi:ribosomal protein S25